MKSKSNTKMEPIPPPISLQSVSSSDNHASISGDGGMFDFDKLKLVEKPDSPMNTPSLPQTLEGCEGFLRALPLRPPNVDQKNSRSIADMVNILSNPEAETALAKAAAGVDEGVTSDRKEGSPPEIFHEKSGVIQSLLHETTKKYSCHGRAPNLMGHVVKPACLSFYNRDGKTFAVPEGRWFINSLKAARWMQTNVSLDQDLIVGNGLQVMIVRVNPGEVGLVNEQGVAVLLDVGTHVFSSGTVSYVTRIQYASRNYFNHGRYHYVRVPRGQFAKVWAEVKGSDGITSLVPRLLRDGEHYVDSHLFKFVGLVNVNEEYIPHGSVHRVSVKKGSVAKVIQDNRPRLLGEGDHLIDSTDFEFQGIQDVLMDNIHIVHGTITILQVTRGQIALAWHFNEPTFIDRPGLYEFNSADFHFIGFKSAEERLIQLGANKIILVQTGEVGVTYDEGVLKILPHGRHVIRSATHIFHRFLSTQQKSIRLTSLSASEKQQLKINSSTKADRHHHRGDSIPSPNSDLTICETKDLVKVGLRADVFYAIQDPEKCIQMINTEELEDLVRETAVATLTNIIRSTALNEIAQSKEVSANHGASDSQGLKALPASDSSPPPTAPMAIFFEKAHDEFLSKLHDDFMMRYGVDIANIRIESFKIMDDELSEQISKHALTTAQIENEMANLEGRRLISVTKEKTAADVKKINAEADATALKTAADAENQRKIDAAKAQAEAHIISVRAQAEAEAEAILTKAKAEAEAIRLKAMAEAERAEMLSRTSLGQQEALLRVYSDMVVQSNKGVEKVVYLDPSVNRDSPFALGSLQNLNFDLHSLTKLGVAASNGNTVSRK